MPRNMLHMNMGGDVTFIPKFFKDRREHLQLFRTTLYPQRVTIGQIENHEVALGALELNGGQSLIVGRWIPSDI
ncbi:hypothetical protein ADK66_26880 [Micromonospora sp. NRRL B-16802]|nr:hypothetical protein ADK66_26880 [Micromonospora sp. NRRL B-16802]